MMFKRQGKRVAERIDTLIGAATVILGDVKFAGGLHVDGRIEGNVDAAVGSGSTLSVSDGGSIAGTVTAPNVVLNGAVNGDIHAYERVELGSTAKVAGNVVYGLIEMAVGAQISGKLIHRPAAEDTAAPVRNQAVP